jgi:uncharacterized protein (TIGR02001 family)
MRTARVSQRTLFPIGSKLSQRTIVIARKDTVAPSVPLRTGYLCMWIAAALLAPRGARAVTLSGDLIYTSDYVFRGVSQTGGRSAGQIDLRAATADGTFVGAFASTLNRLWENEYTPNTGWKYELQTYLGHRFDLSPSWSATFAGTNYTYLDGNVPYSIDYQEISVTTSYLDLWTVELAWIPNAVRFGNGYRMNRYPASVVSTAGQLPLVGRLALAAGAGYYASDNAGYAFGNVGLAYEFKSLRLDAGYYVAQERAANLFPYGRAGSRYAATVSWHF